MQTEGLLGGPNPTGMGLRDGGPQSRVGVAELLEQVLELGASDLHLTAGAKPTVRVNGRLGQLEDYPVLQPAETQAMIYSILTQRQRERLESEQELDCAHALPGKARFRLNVYFQRDSVGAAFRLIPQEIKALEALGIPGQVSSLARLPRGFVLVTGPTGSGKSTTLASMVDLANREREDHIMTGASRIGYRGRAVRAGWTRRRSRAPAGHVPGRLDRDPQVARGGHHQGQAEHDHRRPGTVGRAVPAGSGHGASSTRPAPA
jgi:twitching motility protein PilT